MEALKRSKLKFLNSIIKRQLLKALYLLKFRLHSPAKTPDTSPKPFQPIIKPQFFSSPSSNLLPVKPYHRLTNSHSDLNSYNNPRPSLSNKFKQSSPPLTLFDEIRSTLQTKAGLSESQPTLKIRQTLNSQRQLFQAPKTLSSMRHKRLNTAPEEDLAIVSSKPPKTCPFVINIMDSA